MTVLALQLLLAARCPSQWWRMSDQSRRECLQLKVQEAYRHFDVISLHENIVGWWSISPLLGIMERERFIGNLTYYKGVPMMG